jgi:hypothetical protein
MLPGSDAIRDWRGEQRGRGAVHDSATAPEPGTRGLWAANLRVW